MGEKSKELHKSKIGGQALIEGIMMKGAFKGAMACRLPNGEIETEVWDIKRNKDGKPFWYQKIPIIRGCVNMVCSLIEGYKYMMKSAEKQVEDEEKPKDEKEGKLTETLTDIFMILTIVVSFCLMMAMFIVLPKWLCGFIKPVYERRVLRSLFEGIIKAVIFVGYLALTGFMKDMKRVYMYHGAEHKTIACHEAGLPLTIENVRKQRRFHPRCGTSFIFITVIIGILVGCINPYTVTSQRICFSFILMPLVVGISYECIRIAGKYDNAITRVFSAPGLWLQRITTKEPDDSMIEVAIEAVKPCIPERLEDDLW